MGYWQRSGNRCTIMKKIAVIFALGFALTTGMAVATVVAAIV
jgi:hypothetical protein